MGSLEPTPPKNALFWTLFSADFAELSVFWGSKSAFWYRFLGSGGGGEGGSGPPKKWVNVVGTTLDPFGGPEKCSKKFQPGKRSFFDKNRATFRVFPVDPRTERIYRERSLFDPEIDVLDRGVREG
jgi:hypothetical protein